MRSSCETCKIKEKSWEGGGGEEGRVGRFARSGSSELLVPPWSASLQQAKEETGMRVIQKSVVCGGVIFDVNLVVFFYWEKRKRNVWWFQIVWMGEMVVVLGGLGLFCTWKMQGRGRVLVAGCCRS